MIVPRHYEDLSVLHEGTMPDRAYYIPAGRRLSDPVENREESDRIMMLNGTWRFQYFKSIYDLREEFYRPDYDVSGFDEIPVPGVWQNYGYDTHQYTNIRYPFPADPPFVPQDNPCGAYVYRFHYEKSAETPLTFLEFEGVDSCFYVWMNGWYVGYSQVSHALAEFDVTRFLEEGENVLAVLVLKWCDGSYLEDQDKFRMTGIFRDVYLMRRPEECIRDYSVTTRILDDQSEITVRASYLNQKCPALGTLLDAEGKEVTKFLLTDRHTFTIPSPHLWNSEDPYLYTLHLETEYEVITEQIGIREIAIEGNVVKINGRPVKFRGVNRHDSDPVTGPVVSVAHMRRDLEMMKRHNFNAIRTSHYPNAPMFCQMCDRYGFFVIDEADIEAHGPWMFYYETDTDEERAARWNEMISDNPVWNEAVLDRVRKLIVRDRNRPSVVIWSMGNESGYGCTFERALRWAKEYDPTRLTHYESAYYRGRARRYDYSDIDLYSRMYPTFEDVIRYARSSPDKPYILCEYAHSMGNGPGDYEDYFELIDKYDCICGAFVWEWCDHAVYKGTAQDGRSIYFYGGDHGEYPHDGNFCVDGVVCPDRTPHTGLLEYKNVHRPARVTAFARGNSVRDILKAETSPRRSTAGMQDRSAGRTVALDADTRSHRPSAGPTTCVLTLKNELNFTDLSDYLSLEYELNCDDARIASGIISAPQLPSIPPHGTGKIFFNLPALPEAGRLFLKISYILRRADAFREEGMVLGFDEIAIEEERTNQVLSAFTGQAVVSASMHAPVRVVESDRRLVLHGDSFVYIYDKISGAFESLTYDGHPLLDRPMELNIWRAPTDNDMYLRKEWEKAGYDRAYSRTYETSCEISGGSALINTSLSMSAPTVQKIMDISAVWKITPAGVITVHMYVRKNPEFPELPRFGLRLFLPETMQNVVYYGMGPLESYADKHRASYHGLFAGTVRDLHEDYIRPQENGSHWNCDYVTLCDNSLSLTAYSFTPFSFNASAYTQEELTAKAHNYELEPCGSTVLCLDAKQNGIGSNSCGPRLQRKYRFDEQVFIYEMTLLPEKETE